MSYKTEQEVFWRGTFGDEYVDRNPIPLAENISLFSDVLKATTTEINTVIEWGANIGGNLVALKSLIPNCKFSAVEINHKAIEALTSNAFLQGSLTAYESSILDFDCCEKYDLSLIKLVLIHINPNELKAVYEKLYHSSKKYICICEYYNPTPVEVNYRGNKERLFKRDFAGEFMDLYPDVRLVDYGFVYHRDNMFPQDDVTWFLLEKQS